MSDKFKLFTLKDFINPGSFGPITTILALILTLTVGSKIGLEAIILMWVVSAAFYIPYLVILITRAKWLHRITFITSDGVAVITNKLPILRAEVESIIKQTLGNWEDVTEWPGVRKSLKDTIVEFKTGPLYLYHPKNKKQQVAGYGVKGFYIIEYKVDLNKTALAHELGHEIHAKWTGKISNTAEHAFIKEHGLK